jgi:hypothetical protein
VTTTRTISIPASRISFWYWFMAIAAARVTSVTAIISARTAPKAGDNSFDPFADLAGDIDVTQDEAQAINAAARMFMQSAADKETGEQGKVRAFVYLAKVCDKRSLDFSSKEKRADIGPKLWPTVKDATRGVMFSHLAMFAAAAKLDVLDETVRSVYAKHCQSPVAARQSLFNAVYSALSGRKKAAKDAKLPTTFAPLSAEMVDKAVVPVAKARAQAAKPAEVTPLARLAYWNCRAASS